MHYTVMKKRCPRCESLIVIFCQDCPVCGYDGFMPFEKCKASELEEMLIKRRTRFITHLIKLCEQYNGNKGIFTLTKATLH